MNPDAFAGKTRILRQGSRFAGIGRLGLAVLLIVVATRRADAAQVSPPKQQIPILAWMGVPEKETSVDRYRELAACGITIDFSGFSSIDAAMKALDAAREAGVQVLVSCPELRSDPAGTAKRLRTHPALAGYFLGDEPGAGAFRSLADWSAKVHAADPDHIVYINLLPNYATAGQLGVPTYAQYVDRFAAAVPAATFLSFDFYPVIGPNVRENWYENLEIVAAAAKKAHKPFWAFALSLQHFGYAVPTRENLREQVYSNLAYGAQGIQYFTYWDIPSLRPCQGPIGPDGKPTAIYELVKRMNEEIRARSSLFAGAKLVSVGHTGAHLPGGTRPYVAQAPVASVTTEGNGAIVSRLVNGSREFLVIVNRDIAHPMRARIEFDGSKAIDDIDHAGSSKPLAGRTVDVSVDPGDALIFGWAGGKQ